MSQMFFRSITNKINGGIKRIIIFFYPYAFPQYSVIDTNDPEHKALYQFCKGVGIDVGCGSKKIHPNAIGIDLISRGGIGKYGSEKRQISQADISLSGDNLFLFKDEIFDYVVAKHNLEHYDNPVKTLKEWKRVLKKGGVLGVVIPDDQVLDTMKLDKTHKYAFTKKSFRKLLDNVGDFKIKILRTCVKNWSFVCIAQKV